MNVRKQFVRVECDALYIHFARFQPVIIEQ